MSPSGVYRVKRPPKTQPGQSCFKFWSKGSAWQCGSYRQNFSQEPWDPPLSCNIQWNSSGFCPGKCYKARAQVSLLSGELYTETRSPQEVNLYKRGDHGNNFQSRDSSNKGKQAPFISLGWIFMREFFFKILFIYSWDTHTYRQRQRHRQREKQAPCREPDVGLNPGTQSWDSRIMPWAEGRH